MNHTLDASRSQSGPSVAVVGAGPGGLGAAMLLAASGAKVTIYESQAAVGGRTARLTLNAPGLGDFQFDRGPTFFLMPYVLDEIFSACERKLEDYVDLHRLDPMYRLVLGDAKGPPTVIDTTQNEAEMVRRLRAINTKDADNFPRFLADNRRKLELFTPILRKPFRSALDLLDPAMAKAAPWLRPTKSVHKDLSSYFSDARTRLALCFQTKYLGMSPFKCPSLFTILPLIEYEYGVWHVKGGLNQLVHAMATVCAELGAHAQCSSPVEQIMFEGKKAVGVKVGGREVRYDHVLLNADAAWAIKNLIPTNLRRGLGAWTDKHLDGMDYSCSTYMLYLGLKKPVSLPHHTIYISGDYYRNITDISDNGKLSPDPSLYICNPSALDPSMAPPGCSALYVLVPTPNLKAGIDWTKEADALRERAMDQIKMLTGRDIREDVVVEKRFSPLDWQAMNIQFGATFNLAHGLSQMLHRRPQHELSGVQNVWLAGGGTHPGSGLPVIFLSSQIAARKLCERMGLPYAGSREPAMV